MSFDAAVLDSGDVFWQPWMVGVDWRDQTSGYLPWIPFCLVSETFGDPHREENARLCARISTPSR